MLGFLQAGEVGVVLDRFGSQIGSLQSAAVPSAVGTLREHAERAQAGHDA
jgi:hypothetical protein